MIILVMEKQPFPMKSKFLGIKTLILVEEGANLLIGSLLTGKLPSQTIKYSWKTLNSKEKESHTHSDWDPTRLSSAGNMLSSVCMLERKHSSSAHPTMHMVAKKFIATLAV
jgi:hypothetical protein